jgi:hypothetical protein
LAILSLQATSLAGETFPCQPMNGACFLHDSGLEYVPSRILGIEDVAAAIDREAIDAEPYVDAVADCAREAERLDRQRRVDEYVDGALAALQLLKSRTQTSLALWSPRALWEWNRMVTSVGRGIARAVILDDRSNVDGLHDVEIAPRKLQRNANIYVFTLTNHPDLDMGSSSFARDYCVFAPYALEDITPVTRQPWDAFVGPPPPPRDGWDQDPVVHAEVGSLHVHATVSLQRALSRAIATRLHWLGRSLMQWSEDMENGIRVAEASDNQWLDEIK